MLDNLFAAADKWLEDSKKEREDFRAYRKALRKEEKDYYDAIDKAKRYFGESKSRVDVLTKKDYDSYVNSIGGEAPGWTQMVKDYYAGKPIALKYSDLDFFNDLVNNADNDNFEM